jgi:tetratricopeptide (TPR) repeat protein
VNKSVQKQGNKKVSGVSPKSASGADSGGEAFSGPVAEILRETEVGLFILHHRNLMISLTAILLVALIGYGANSYYQHSIGQQQASLSYSFSQEALADLSQKKITTAEFAQKYNALDLGLRNSSSFTPILLSSVAELVRQDDRQSALMLLESQGGRGRAPRNYGDYLVARWMVTIYEDLGEGQKAVEMLEGLNSAPFKVLEARNYLDLGRIYISLENYEKASLNLDYLIQNFPNDQLGKVAKIYLEQINK